MNSYNSPIPTPSSTLGLGGPYQTLDESTYKDIITTIINEVSPDVSLSNQLPDGNALDVYLTSYLRAAGYSGDGSDRKSIISFLESTLQAHRLKVRRNTRNQNIISSDDVRLASALSRIVKSLDIMPSSDEDDRTILLKSLRTAQSSLQELNTESLGNLLISAQEISSMSSAQKASCEKITEVLKNEQRTRIGLLLTRLQVTTQSFSQTAENEANRFELMQKDVEQSSGDGVSLFEALAAREWILEEKTISSERNTNDKVKGFVMGQVPDRGGRLKDSVGVMPKFRERIPSTTEQKMSRGKNGRSKHRKRKG